jgi:transglutaminase-like putative cysteine protease
MNIPARYVTGYLGDIGIPPVPEPMDFSAWDGGLSWGPVVHI